MSCNLSKSVNSERIRITYLVDFFRTINAGTEKQLSHLLTYLPEAGYSVQLISFQDNQFLKNEAQRFFPMVGIHSLGAKPDISKSLQSLVRLYRLLRNSKPHIVHTFFPTSNSFGVLISWLAGIRTIVSSRRDMGYNLTSKDIAFLKIANCFVSCVLTNARAVQEHTIKVEGIQRKKTRVIYNGISFDDYNRSSHKNVQKEPVIGIVANLNRPVKRVDLFIKAASIIHKDFPNVKFWIIGDGHIRNDLERLASSLGIDSNVFFMGRRGDVKQLLMETTVGVVCSDSEGFSNAIMEYMGAGLPVVATDVGGNSELVQHGETGFLVSPNDARELAGSLRNLLNNPKAACRMGYTGREFLNRKFPIDEMIQKTRDLYESFLI